MIRHFGRGAARARALQERREIALETTEEGRLRGRCDLCGELHAFPDLRDTCRWCGEIRCAGGCRCEEGGD